MLAEAALGDDCLPESRHGRRVGSGARCRRRACRCREDGPRARRDGAHAVAAHRRRLRCRLCLYGRSPRASSPHIAALLLIIDSSSTRRQFVGRAAVERITGLRLFLEQPSPLWSSPPAIDDVRLFADDWATSEPQSAADAAADAATAAHPLLPTLAAMERAAAALVQHARTLSLSASVCTRSPRPPSRPACALVLLTLRASASVVSRRPASRSPFRRPRDPGPFPRANPGAPPPQKDKEPALVPASWGAGHVGCAASHDTVGVFPVEGFIALFASLAARRCGRVATRSIAPPPLPPSPLDAAPHPWSRPRRATSSCCRCGRCGAPCHEACL
jgi:hypothetical protein